MEIFTEFDHCVINVTDIPLALHFYGTILGEILGDAEITDMTYMSLEEVLQARAQTAKRQELHDIAGILPSPHTGVRFGEALLPIFLHHEHVQEPPPEQLVGTPRLGLPVTHDQMEKAVEVLTRYRVPFEGPIDYAGPCPAERSLYFKDPASNFLELSVSRDPITSRYEKSHPTKVHWFKMLLEVSDSERSERFYRDDLGLQSVGRDLWPADPAPNTTFQTADGGYVVLVQVPDPRPDGPAQHRNFMLPFEDYERVFERVQERGWLRPNYRTEMGVRSIGEVTCSLFDPDRHRLQLTAWREPYEVPASNRGKVVAGRIDDFAVGSVTFNQQGRFYLLRTHDGFLALNQVCTHLQCNVTYQPEHYQYYCYCHNRRFTRTGRQMAVRVDVPPLHKYAVELIDGLVVVDTDQSIPRSEEEADRMDVTLAQAEARR